MEFKIKCYSLSQPVAEGIHKSHVAQVEASVFGQPSLFCTFVSQQDAKETSTAKHITVRIFLIVVTL